MSNEPEQEHRKTTALCDGAVINYDPLPLPRRTVFCHGLSQLISTSLRFGENISRHRRHHHRLPPSPYPFASLFVLDSKYKCSES